MPLYSIQDWANGDPAKDLRDTRLDHIETGIFDSEAVPYCKARHNAAVSIATGAALVAVALNTDVNDPDGMHDPVTNNNRVNILETGFYIVSFNAEFAANATGGRQAAIRDNAANLIAAMQLPPVSGEVTRINISQGVFLTSGAWVEAAVAQTSGGALNLNSTAGVSPELSVSLIAYA